MWRYRHGLPYMLQSPPRLAICPAESQRYGALRPSSLFNVNTKIATHGHETDHHTMHFETIKELGTDSRDSTITFPQLNLEQG